MQHNSTLAPAVVPAEIEWTQAARNDWPEPDLSLLNITRYPAPAFPLEALGPVLSEWVRLTGESKSCPGDYAAAGLLAAAATLIGNARWVRAWAEWTEPPALWLAVVGNPSSGKSPGLDPTRAMLRKIEADMRPAFDERKRAYDTACEVARAHLEKWRADVEKAASENRSAPERPKIADEPDKPQLPRLVVNDFNEPVLNHIMSGQPKGLLAFRDELSGWLAGMDRNGASERPFFLEAWRGGSHTVDRVKLQGEPIRVDRLTLSVVGGLQPDRLASAVLAGDDDGLAARFNYFWPETVPFSRPRNEVNNAVVERAFQRLSSLQLRTDEQGNDCPCFISLDEPSQDLLEAFCRSLRECTDTGLMGSYMGKQGSTVIRLALVLEFLWWAVSDDAREPQTVSETALKAALWITSEYFIPMARRSFMDAGLPQDVRLAKATARWIVKERVDFVNKRDLHRSGKIPGLDTAAKADQACEALQDSGWLSLRKDRKGDHGRYSINYEVNPLVLERVKK